MVFAGDLSLMVLQFTRFIAFVRFMRINFFLSCLYT